MIASMYKSHQEGLLFTYKDVLKFLLLLLLFLNAGFKLRKFIYFQVKKEKKSQNYIWRETLKIQQF